uniref:Uncharacterized protein n=1 Tax=Micrurus paraensis TaxID=1970185 RepID=A0A2D4K4R2_9SAUR
MPFLIFGAQGSSESNELCSPKAGHINLNKFHKGNKMKGYGKSNHFCSMDLHLLPAERSQEYLNSMPGLSNTQPWAICHCQLDNVAQECLIKHFCNPTWSLKVEIYQVCGSPLVT